MKFRACALRGCCFNLNLIEGGVHKFTGLMGPLMRILIIIDGHMDMSCLGVQGLLLSPRKLAPPDHPFTI